MIKCALTTSCTTMLAAEQYSNLFAGVALHKRKPLQIHRSRISLHCAKAGYSYPTIRLPHYLSSLAGLSTRIYQTVHDGALAFLVVVSSSPKAAKKSAKIQKNATRDTKSPRLDMAEVAGEDYPKRNTTRQKKSRLKEMRQIEKEELEHVPRGDMPQQELGLLYPMLRMHSLGRKGKSKDGVLGEAIESVEKNVSLI